MFRQFYSSKNDYGTLAGAACRSWTRLSACAKNSTPLAWQYWVLLQCRNSISVLPTDNYAFFSRRNPQKDEELAGPVRENYENTTIRQWGEGAHASPGMARQETGFLEGPYQGAWHNKLLPGTLMCFYHKRKDNKNSKIISWMIAGP